MKDPRFYRSGKHCVRTKTTRTSDTETS